MPLGANKAAIMGVAGTAAAGDVVLILSQTASGDDDITFDSGIDSTYGEYIFRFYNINPATDKAEFQFQANAAGASGYNETITSSFFQAVTDEADGGASVSYNTVHDKAQDTGYQVISADVGNGADESSAGELHLFNPSSTTYVKHFYARFHVYDGNNNVVDHHIGGYFNVTTAIDDIQFKMSTGAFDGVIKMWGVK